MAKETFFFKHDYNARNDRKIINAIMKHGMQGIGVYWCLVEILYEEGGYSPIEYERISFELRTDTDVIKSIINDFGLFKTDAEKFWSDAILERLNDRCNKSEKARESINKRWGKYKRKTNVKRTKYEHDTKEKRGEEKRGEEKRGDEKRVFVAPTLEEVEIYFGENGYKQEAAGTAYKYYSTANWTDSKGDKVRNWKQKMIAVWFKPENKIQVNADDEEYKKLRKTVYGE